MGEIMSYPLPLSFSFLFPLFTMLLPLSLTMWSRPSLPQLLLLLPSPLLTSFLLTRSLLRGSLPLFLPQLLNLSFPSLPLPLHSPFPLPQPLPQFQLLLLLSLHQASSMLRMSLDSSALDTRTLTQPRLRPRMLLE